MTSSRSDTGMLARRPIDSAGDRRGAGRYPSDEELKDFLIDAFSRRGPDAGEVILVDRDRSIRFSTFSNELVTCLVDGSEIRILCKYAQGKSWRAFGHRGGIEYEAAVYRHVLDSLGSSTPIYYASRSVPASDEHWLALEYIDGKLTVSKGPQPAAIISAAQWIAAFHESNAKELAEERLDPLIRYDEVYYVGWANRLRNSAGHLSEDHPWLPEICDRFVDLVPRIRAIPQTLVHGEFTVSNVMVRLGNSSAEVPGHRVVVAPIDWESAAIAFGEIDLAFLLDRWPTAIQEACVDQYKRARWGANPPVDFDDRLRMARLYLHLRWLGKSVAGKKTSYRCDQLRLLGKQLGII